MQTISKTAINWLTDGRKYQISNRAEYKFVVAPVLADQTVKTCSLNDPTWVLQQVEAPLAIFDANQHLNAIGTLKITSQSKVLESTDKEKSWDSWMRPEELT